MTLAQFTIPGAPRTKKTSNRIVRAGKFPKVLPSQAYTEWNRKSLLFLAYIRNTLDTPITDPVNVRATFFRDANRGDAAGYYQALGDTLEAAGIIANDKQILSWDGTRLRKDAANPRVEVRLERVDEA
jgi:Holliday junction resolvase RusA-like endonuclease